MTQTLTGHYGQTITPGISPYGLSLAFTSTAQVLPTATGADGVFSAAANVNLTLDGYGYIAAGNGTGSAAAGIGIDLTGSSIVTINTPSTAPGSGLHGVVGGTNFSGAGGVGVSMTGGGQLTNDSGASIFGGTGYTAVGAAAVVAAGGTIVTNDGTMYGGQNLMAGGSGGAGVQLSGGAKLYNHGTVQGDQAYTAMTNGGIGVVADGAGVVVQNYASIYGGNINSNNANAVSAGVGVKLSNGAALTTTATGAIHGGKAYNTGSSGTYVAGTVGGNAADIYSGATLTVDSGGYLRGGEGATIGAGVYLDGGTLINNGGDVQAGIDQTATPIIGNAVEFGPKGGELVVYSGAFFGGTIAGFAAGDSVDFKGWVGPNSQSATFTGGTFSIAAGNGDGTLNFAGLTPGGSFTYASDGSGGTLVTLTGPGSAVTQPIVIGSSSYPNPLVVGDGGTVGAGGPVISVTPSGEGALTAVTTSLASGATLTVNANGSITGGASNGSGGVTNAGSGVAISGPNASVTVNSGGSVTGGYSGTTGVHGGTGVSMGASGGTHTFSLTNHGIITGGAGNAGGGYGVSLANIQSATAATFTNDGKVYGGSSYAGPRFGSAPQGGTGVSLNQAVYLNNTGLIEGGAGGVYGGIGLQLVSGAQAYNKVGGTIEGGSAGLNQTGGIGVDILQGSTLTTAALIEGGAAAGAHGVAGNAVDFAYIANFGRTKLVIDPGASFVGNIAGFGKPDQYIDITNLTRTGTSSAFTSSTYTMSTPEGNLTFTGLTVGNEFVFNSDGGSGTDITVACFLRGTRIRTERGEAPIETLAIGDRVLTMSGIVQPIKWIGRRSYSRACAAGNPEIMPIKIARGALGDHLPARDLWVSPEHAMLIDGMLIPAATLVNGTSIIQDDTIDDVTYLHLEFDTHVVIFAEGALAESFVDDASREMFDNAAQFDQLYPHAVRTPARFCAPRVEDGWELEAVRRRLAERALSLTADTQTGREILRTPA